MFDKVIVVFFGVFINIFVYLKGISVIVGICLCIVGIMFVNSRDMFVYRGVEKRI